MEFETLMKRIVELADGVPCRITYLKDVTGASEATIRRALRTLTSSGELRSTTITFYTKKELKRRRSTKSPTPCAAKKRATISAANTKEKCASSASAKP